MKTSFLNYKQQNIIGLILLFSSIPFVILLNIIDDNIGWHYVIPALPSLIGIGLLYNAKDLKESQTKC